MKKEDFADDLMVRMILERKCSICSKSFDFGNCDGGVCDLCGDIVCDDCTDWKKLRDSTLDVICKGDHENC